MAVAVTTVASGGIPVVDVAAIFPKLGMAVSVQGGNKGFLPP